MKTKPVKIFTVDNTTENIELINKYYAAYTDYGMMSKFRKYAKVRLLNSNEVNLLLIHSATIQGKYLNHEQLCSLMLLNKDSWSTYINSL